MAAGLMVRTFDHLLKVDPGFNPSRVVTFELSLPLSKYKDVDTIARLYHKVIQELQLVPGVQSVGLGSTVPLGGAPDGTAIRVPDHPTLNFQEKPFANYSFASPQYFVAIGAPLLRGRDFAETDTLDSVPVTIINSTMAKKFWPGEDPLGKQVGVSTERWPTRTIIGIVGDIRRMSLQEEPGPEMYVPYAQNEIKVWPSMETMQAAIHTQADPASVMTGVREAIHSVDSGLPVSKVATLESLVSSSTTQTRFALSVLVVFGAVALLLASIGMFGVISYTVTKQTREIGVRMAIGAKKSDIFKMVLKQGTRLTCLGILIGLAVATSLTHMMASFLYGIRATDPLTFAAVSLLCAAVTFCACYLPAYRATKIDPMEALRQE